MARLCSLNRIFGSDEIGWDVDRADFCLCFLHRQQISMIEFKRDVYVLVET